MKKSELIKIGKKAIVEMYGEKFVKKYQGNMCLTTDRHGTENLFTVGATADTKPLEMTQSIVLDETPSEDLAIVKIDPTTGKVYKDYQNSKLPR